MQVTIDASDVRTMGSRYKDASNMVKAELAAGMDRALSPIQQDIRNHAPVDTGRLRNSIRRDTHATGTTLTGRVGSDLAYSDPVDQGRSAGAPMPPQGVLLGWMSRHGIPAKAEYVVRRAIGRRGIPATHFISGAIERNRDLLRREFGTKVLTGIVGRLSGGKG